MTTTERVSISVAEAAKRVGISQRYAYYLNSRHELAGAYRMGNRILVHVETLDAWAAAQATKVSPSGLEPAGPATGGSARGESA